MTIDDARYCLENGFCGAGCKYFSEGGPNCEDNARKIAIDTMRKYQKIKQIITSNYYLCDELLLRHIKEVLEDGNDD